MAKGDPLYAHVEVSFILNDPRCRAMTNAEFRLYLAFWCTAVEQRSDKLPTYFDLHSMSNRAAVDLRTCSKCVTKLQQKCLIDISSDGCYIVVGCRAKHSNLRNWKDNIDPQLGATEAVEEPEAVTETPKPPSGCFEYDVEMKFIEFWDAYPKRPNNPKKGARAKWMKLVKSGEEPDALTKAASNYARFRGGSDPSMTKMAQTFLGSSGAWEEWVDPPEENFKKHNDGSISQGSNLNGVSAKYCAVDKTIYAGPESKEADQ